METIKGFARRATQSAKEKFAHADATNDDRLLETSRKVRQQEKSCSVIIEKIGKMCRVLDEFANVSREIGDEYRMNLDQGSEMCQLAEDCRAFGNEMAQKVQEFQKTLKDGAFEPLSAFMKEIAKLKDYEEDRKKKQLEFDFFRTKVAELRRNPPKDSSRIPRNEQKLEQWRRDLWQSTENSKAFVSGLFSQAQRALDQAVLACAQTIMNYSALAAGVSKNHFASAHLPLYPTAPILPPTPLPPLAIRVLRGSAGTAAAGAARPARGPAAVPVAVQLLPAAAATIGKLRHRPRAAPLAAELRVPTRPATKPAATATIRPTVLRSHISRPLSSSSSTPRSHKCRHSRNHSSCPSRRRSPNSRRDTRHSHNSNMQRSLNNSRRDTHRRNNNMRRLNSNLHSRNNTPLRSAISRHRHQRRLHSNRSVF